MTCVTHDLCHHQPSSQGLTHALHTEPLQKHSVQALFDCCRKKFKESWRCQKRKQCARENPQGVCESGEGRAWKEESHVTEKPRAMPVPQTYTYNYSPIPTQLCSTWADLRRRAPSVHGLPCNRHGGMTRLGMTRGSNPSKRQIMRTSKYSHLSWIVFLSFLPGSG